MSVNDYSYSCKPYRYFVGSPSKVIDVDQYLLKLFENVSGLVCFLNHPVVLRTDLLHQ